MRYSRRQFTKSAILFAGWSTCTTTLFASKNQIHIVKEGETLSRISRRYGVSTSQIRSANNIHGDLIRVGQRLVVPTANATSYPSSLTTYIVSKGDTLGALAIRFGVSVQELKDHNNLKSDTIRVGQQLYIPSVAGTGGSSNLLAKVKAETARINIRRDNWKRIVVHHSGIKFGNATKYDAAHRRRGMKNGLAYHFVIGNGIDSGDGEIEVGPRWKKQLLGGHVKNYKINLTAIGICIVGNFEETHPSKKQLEAFTQLMDWLRSEVVPGARKFAGHRELRGEQTVCPGKNFPLAAMHRRFPD